MLDVCLIFLNLYYSCKFITHSINVCEHILYFAVFVPISLHSQATFVIKFNSLNFSKWCKQVQFHLGILDLDLALLSEKPLVLTTCSSTK